jgi:prepilin-type N-terminal cleavage/methylation domain-containing protein
MNRLRITGSHRGMTLIEVMTTLTILAIISVGVSGLYIQAIKLYKRGERESTSRDKAALALEKMMPEIREAYNVDYPGPSLIVFTLPQKDNEGHYLVDPATKTLVAGPQVAFFQSDANGSYDDTNGRYIWRSQRPDPDHAWESKGAVMDCVEDLTFTYAPSLLMLELVRATITIGQGEYPGYYNRTEVGEVWIRNH